MGSHAGPTPGKEELIASWEPCSLGEVLPGYQRSWPQEQACFLHLAALGPWLGGAAGSMNFRLSSWDPGLITIPGSAGSTRPAHDWPDWAPASSTSVIPGGQGSSGPSRPGSICRSVPALLPDVCVLWRVKSLFDGYWG